MAKRVITGSSPSGVASRFSARTKAPAAASPSRTTKKRAAKRTAKPSRDLHPAVQANIPPLWKHQQQTLSLLRRQDKALDLSDPGTGKTAASLTAFAERRREGSGAALVLAPKSLLRTAWYDDACIFTPDMLCSVAYSTNREAAFEADADIYITNVDAVKWLVKQPKKFFKRFDTILIDELIAYKHRTSDRSRAINKIIDNFDFRVGLNGTFMSGMITDTWHQTYLIDGGQRLGKNFFQFRSATQNATQNGPRAEHIKWENKPGAIEAVAGLLSDIAIRHEFDKVMDVPPNYTRSVKFYPPAKLMRAYQEMAQTAILEMSTGEVTAVNAAVLRNKLLQIASGAVYSAPETYHVIDNDRYTLIVELALETPHSVVFFNWAHQKEQLARMLQSQHVPFEIIDGKVPIRKREEIVHAYQRGEYRTLLLHPQTGAHGLTLTKGTRTIWSSPIYQPDFLKQGMHRIWRGGQTQETETLLVHAEGTVEDIVYSMLNKKGGDMMSFLDMLAVKGH